MAVSYVSSSAGMLIKTPLMKAKKKPVKELSLGDVDLSPASSKVKFKNFELPPEKPAVKMLKGDAASQAKELVDLLMHEAKVL